MKKTAIATPGPDVDRVILTIRGQKVILDADLAAIYGVTTKALNQAVKRNESRFPLDFLFRLTPQEFAQTNRSQFVTGFQRHRDPRFPPFAFTEHGAIMAATVLNSPRAVQMPPLAPLKSLQSLAHNPLPGAGRWPGFGKGGHA